MKRIPGTTLKSTLIHLMPQSVERQLRSIWHRWNQARLAHLQEELLMIVREHPVRNPILIFAPSLDWHTALFQRPQHLAFALSQQGCLVFYVHMNIDSRLPTFQRIHPNLFLCNVPPETFFILHSPWVYILTWNRGYLSAFQEPRVIYDHLDALELHEGDSIQILEEHNALIQSAELVLVTSKCLHQDTIKIRPDALLCTNGVDYEHFRRAQNPARSPIPPDLEPILERGKPVICYYGALARWFDYSLMGELAHLRDDMMFMLIGPNFDGTLPQDLLQIANVHWLGEKEYVTLPVYLSYIDVGIIPFEINEITHAVSPLKLFEYMAAHKPVVVTPMQESMQYPGVLVARDAREFSSRLDQALNLKDEIEYMNTLDSVARKNTWHSKAVQILESLD